MGTAAGANLTLVHATPVVSTDTIAFEMNAAAPEAALTLNQLTVATGLASVNIDSTGAATTNVITNISSVDDNITVTGGTDLTLGSAAAADHYTFASGTINALNVEASGGVTAFLWPTVGTAQTFVAGPAGSTNVANVFGAVAAS